MIVGQNSLVEDHHTDPKSMLVFETILEEFKTMHKNSKHLRICGIKVETKKKGALYCQMEVSCTHQVGIKSLMALMKDLKAGKCRNLDNKKVHFSVVGIKGDTRGSASDVVIS